MSARPDSEQFEEVRSANIVQLNANAFHNIGNVATIAKLTIDSLRETTDTEALDYMLSDLLPALRAAATGESDTPASDYVQALAELLEHQQTALMRQIQLLGALDTKLRHIGDIIDVQRRMASGDGNPHLTSIPAVLADCTRMITESATRRGVNIHTDFADTPCVMVDAAQITQVVLNLLKNGMEAMEGAPGKKSLIAKAFSERGQAICQIMDSGAGLRENQCEQIFAAGYSTKPSHSHGGLGLYYCRLTIEQYRGKIFAIPREGGGIIVQFELPAVENA